MHLKAWHRWSATALSAFLSLSVAAAQESAGLREFLADQGRDLDVRFNFDTGRPTEIFGQAMDVGWRPGTDDQFVAASLEIVDSYPGMFGYSSASLEVYKVYHARLAAIGSSDKVAVSFRQVADGIPVLDGWLTMLWSADGRLLNISNKGLPGVESVDLVPAVEQQAATQIAIEAFGREVERVESSEILLREEKGQLEPALVWSIELSAQEWEDGLPVAEAIMVDAHDGHVVARENRVHSYTDLIGKIRGGATPGTAPDTNSNPVVRTSLQAAHVTSAVGNTDTLADGSFTIVYGGNTNQAVTVAFGSTAPYAYVDNKQGNELVRTKTFTPGVFKRIILNPKGKQYKTSQVNAHKCLLDLLNFIAAIDPSDTTMFFRQRMNVNINSSCNAYYDGISTNYYRAAGGCVNTAYSTVIAHETGHWANDKYGQRNGGDGFGEGNADNWGMYVYDDNIVGRDFCGPGCYVRNGLNNRQYCGSCCAGCYGEVHRDGEVLMGACWKARANLNNSLGDAPGDLVADTLFITWVNAYPGDRCICQGIDDHWLEIDDDNGNLNDGTPNGTDIDNGFKAQGFPGYY